MPRGHGTAWSRRSREPRSYGPCDSKRSAGAIRQVWRCATSPLPVAGRDRPARPFEEPKAIRAGPRPSIASSSEHETHRDQPALKSGPRNPKKADVARVLAPVGSAPHPGVEHVLAEAAAEAFDARGPVQLAALGEHQLHPMLLGPTDEDVCGSTPRRCPGASPRASHRPPPAGSASASHGDDGMKVPHSMRSASRLPSPITLEVRCGRASCCAREPGNFLSTAHSNVSCGRIRRRQSICVIRARSP